MLSSWEVLEKIESQSKGGHTRVRVSMEGNHRECKSGTKEKSMHLSGKEITGQRLRSVIRLS